MELFCNMEISLKILDTRHLEKGQFILKIQTDKDELIKHGEGVLKVLQHRFY